MLSKLKAGFISLRDKNGSLVDARYYHDADDPFLETRNGDAVTRVVMNEAQAQAWLAQYVANEPEPEPEPKSKAKAKAADSVAPEVATKPKKKGLW